MTLSGVVGAAGVDVAGAVAGAAVVAGSDEALPPPTDARDRSEARSTGTDEVNAIESIITKSSHLSVSGSGGTTVAAQSDSRPTSGTSTTILGTDNDVTRAGITASVIVKEKSSSARTSRSYVPAMARTGEERKADDEASEMRGTESSAQRSADDGGIILAQHAGTSVESSSESSKRESSSFCTSLDGTASTTSGAMSAGDGGAQQQMQQQQTTPSLDASIGQKQPDTVVVEHNGGKNDGGGSHRCMHSAKPASTASGAMNTGGGGAQQQLQQQQTTLRSCSSILCTPT